MKLSLNWLKKYVDFKLTVDELSDKLTMAGLEVEAVINKTSTVKGIIVGTIIEVTDHPNADKLKLCKVDIGNQLLSIICGADNVSEDQKVPVAIKGAVIAGGYKIKNVKLRGVISEGMICSESELGIGDSHEGIMVLNKDDYNVGDDFTVAQSEDDTILEIDVTPNRPDCLSHIGIAREISLITNNDLLIPDIQVVESNIDINNLISIKIDDPVACPRYCARVIKNVKIKDSPQWLRNYLANVGIRSINNVVDITNFVLMETGHPLHAFDYDLLSDKIINIRKARFGEKFTTLDNITHQLDNNDLLICDGPKGIALAGIMGGNNSEISASTKNILLESAFFDPMTIRKTAKKLGISTEASQRFERGADPENTIYTINRAAQLLHEIANGDIAKNIFDKYPNKIKKKNITLRYSRIYDVIGIEIPKFKIISILKGLELAINKETEITINLTVPSFRPDLNREIDLIEEIVRLYGYDKIKPNLYTKIYFDYSENLLDENIEIIKDFFVGHGFIETVTNTLVSKKHVDIQKNSSPVTIKNPLSPETGFLRNSCIPSMLDSLKWNFNRSVTDLRLFEIGKIFHSQKAALPVEEFKIICSMSGKQKENIFWLNNNTQTNFYHLKGILESFCNYFHIVKQYSLKKEKKPFFNDTISFSILLKDSLIGSMGEIDKTLLNEWDIKQPVFVLELDIEKLINHFPKNLKYEPISRYPSVCRDLAVVIDENIPISDIKECITNAGGKYLQDVNLFDVYTGKGIPSDKKSTAFSLIFKSYEKTLTEDEIDPFLKIILKSLKKNISAVLRD